MPHAFADDVRSAILRHMNVDHRDDNVLIARALIDTDASAAEMVDLDGDGGVWSVRIGSRAPIEARIPWLGGSITERPAVRREIVALYDEACARMGVKPRPHG